MRNAKDQEDDTLDNVPNNVVVELKPEMPTFAQLYAQHRRMTTAESVNVILRIRFYKVSRDLVHEPGAKEAMNKFAPGVADCILDLWRSDQIQSRSSRRYANIGSEAADGGMVEVSPILAKFAQLYAEYASNRAGDLDELHRRGEAVNFILALFLSDQEAALLRDSHYRAELDKEVRGIAGRILQLAGRCFGNTDPRRTEGPDYTC